MVNGLSPTMTLRDFENGYWYLEQLKNFAERIGIPAAKKCERAGDGWTGSGTKRTSKLLA